MSIGKQDAAARELLGPAYDSIPKSVFAVAAYYLADICSDEGVGNGRALNRLREEFDCIGGQVIDRKQADRAIRALDRQQRGQMQ
jgi:hypothetical protein